MPESYELRKMLEEILDDEEIGASKHAKISQSEIRRMLLQRQQQAVTPASDSKYLLGEMLVEQGVITKTQLEEALEVQSQRGGKLGSIFVELGYLQPDKLLEVLAKKHGIEGADLFRMKNIDQTMSAIPSSVMIKHRVIPLRIEGRAVKLAMANPEDAAAVHEVEFMTGRRVEPVIVPSYQMDLAIKCIEENGGKLLLDRAREQTARSPLTIKNMLSHLIHSGASDLLITAGISPSVKMHHVLERMNMPSVTSEQCIAYAKALMTEKQWERFLQEKELDFAIGYEDLGRFRANAYQQKNTISLAIRRISNSIPSLTELGLPNWIEELTLRPSGLIIIAAPTGHGKTTSLNAMVDIINTKRKCNIISLEDPVEYIHKPKKSNINQREVGTDTDSFSEGLKRIFRQAPDVIVIGEMRDMVTFETAITAASSGHLVLSTMHAQNATAALEGLVGRFPREYQTHVQYQLAEALLLAFSQRLIPSQKTNSLVVAYEKLINSYRMKNAIRENKLYQIRAQIQQDSDDFSSMDISLVRLVKEEKISMDTALLFAENIDYVKRMCS
jgi:twitching motility protein PilT